MDFHLFNRSWSPSKRDDCFNPSPNNTLTDRMNEALNSSGAGYVLSLCPNTEYQTTAPILFAFPDQEISTQGYPTDDSRAVITISGSRAATGGHTTAVDGTCSKCSGVTLRNIQVRTGYFFCMDDLNCVRVLTFT